MPDTRTGRILRDAAHYLNDNGLWTGDQFATNDPWPRLDICAAIYWAATNTLPTTFRTDEGQAIDLIRNSRWAMDAICHLSSCLDTRPGIDQDTGQTDYIAHVSQWPLDIPIDGTDRPSEAEVIGRIFRAAEAADTRHSTAA